MFGNKEKKQAEEAAAKEEADRLCALPVVDLAAAIMPAFGPDGPGHGDKGLNVIQVMQYPLASFPKGAQFLRQLHEPVREAVQLLERAGLVRTELYGGAGGGGRLFVTRLGRDALAEGTVRGQLSQTGAR